MALSLTVAKVSVKQIMPGAFEVLLNLQAKESGVTVIDDQFYAVYKQGTSVSKVEDVIRNRMQARIDAWKAADTIMDSAAIDGVVTRIQSALVG